MRTATNTGKNTARETGLTVFAKNSSIKKIPGIIATMAATRASRNSRTGCGLTAVVVLMSLI